MRDYALALAVGLGVGVLYALIGVRSPAPPLVALAGLLGMVLGEQAVLRLRAVPTAVERAAPAQSPAQDGAAR